MAPDLPRFAGSAFQRNPDSKVDVLVEPKPGNSDTEVVCLLQKGGAAFVEILAPGFISAQVPYGLLETLEPVAYVEQQSEKQLRYEAR